MSERVATDTRRLPLLFRVAEALRRLSGWRRLLLAAGLGALGATAFAPLYLLPVLWVAFCGLVWLLDGTERRGGAFWTGWAFGFGHFAVGFYWVGIAFTVDAPRYGAFGPVAVVALAGGMAVFPALVALAVQSLRWRGPARVLGLTAIWLLTEWLRSWLFGGFPWNLMGSAWVVSGAMMQFAAMAGVWGLSALTVLAAAAPAVLADTTMLPRARWGFVAAVGVLLVLVWGGGAIRLAAAPDTAMVPDVKLRLVQPSIEQALKWEPSLRARHVERQIEMTLGPGYEDITHVIWAETAVPFHLSVDPDLQRFLGQAAPAGGALITGAPRTEPGDSDRRLWNSLHAVGPSGTLLATYDKVKLVIFGEYVPLRSIFNFAKITAGRIDFSPGPGRVTTMLPNLPPFSPLICYEVIFPGAVVAPGPRPDWLLTITNDAWFGTSTGPYQHFASAQLRAVEEGLPIIRVANGGISGVVDGYGRVLDRLGLNEIGVIDTGLPQKNQSVTLFARIGNWVVVILVALLGLVGLKAHRTWALPVPVG